MSVSTTAAARLRKDYSRIMKDPVPFITAHPHPSNILEWHYVVTGPPGSSYENGVYHGKLVFPPEYPFKPPSIYMLTPNGRFSVNTRLCLSISDFHPDTWNPAWSVSTILTGLLSFMLESAPTLGSIEASDRERRNLAQRSLEYNLKCKLFCDIFPELAKELRERVAAVKAADLLRTNSALSNGAISGATNDVERVGGGGIGSIVSNILVIVGVAVFAFAARYILKSVA